MRSNFISKAFAQAVDPYRHRISDLTRHLVAVWNPSYAASAMDEHLSLLLHWAQRYEAGKASDDDLYVWWGKVRSANRQKPQENIPDIRAAAALGSEREVHLYLTDYRSLYVGEVLGVADAELTAKERERAPAYYAERELNCDFWFKLGDIRRLVVDDTLLVIEELKKLSNVHYNDRPVSLYGGMVDLPLVVTRQDRISFFDETERERLTDGRLWAELDAEAGTGLAATERDLRENRFGDQLWTALEPGARTFIATGERIYREHRGDAAFDFAPVLSSFAKAIEVQANAILRRTWPSIAPKLRLMNFDGNTVDLGDYGSLDLGKLAKAIAGDKELNAALIRQVHHGKWFAEILPVVIDAFRDVRNPGTHSVLIDRATATQWRERLIGVGCAGDLIELAKCCRAV
jgi:hypothetical protein